jgi:diguanylate cyclase (GGDEF)-like protein
MEVIKNGRRFIPKIQLSARKMSYGLLATVVLVVMAKYNNLLFHTMMEGLNIILAALIYVLAVKTFRYSKNNPLLFLGYSYFFVGIFYGLHLLTQTGVNLLPGLKSNATFTTLHLEYFIQAVTFLVIPFFIQRHFSKKLFFGVYFLVTLFLAGGSLFNQLWPFQWWDGLFLFQMQLFHGAVILLFAVAGYHFYRKQKQFNPQIYLHIQAAIVFTMIAAGCGLLTAGTSYFSVIGHLARVIANLWVYRLIITFGIEAPYDLIFKELKNNVILDPLTGIYNRNGLLEFIKKELGRVRRADSKAGILVMDLDNFKKVNDRYGHLAGDQVLKSFAAILKTTVRESDIICRFGGDEFVVLIKGDREVLDLVRWRIREAFQSWQETDEIAHKIGLSIGGSLWESDDKINIEQMLKEADSSMYNEKMKKKTVKKRTETVQLTMFGN